MARGLCVGADPDLFFPEKGQARNTLIAQAICLDCPVFAECTEYRNRVKPPYGTWAGVPSKRGES